MKVGISYNNHANKPEFEISCCLSNCAQVVHPVLYVFTPLYKMALTMADSCLRSNCSVAEYSLE